ncbi:hypothetical protein [Liquorilactobacillus satsumensis]|uniref:hypothetical protein n=1 Tax=Liquorilactobacillus satsumensis TaxID=259059 RepID=UPI0039EC4414
MKHYKVHFAFCSGQTLAVKFTADSAQKAVKDIIDGLGSGNALMFSDGNLVGIPDQSNIDFFTLTPISEEKVEVNEND